MVQFPHSKSGSSHTRAKERWPRPRASRLVRLTICTAGVAASSAPLSRQ